MLLAEPVRSCPRHLPSLDGITASSSPLHGDSWPLLSPPSPPRRAPGVAPHLGEGGELRVCIDILGLNRAASQERFWPSCAGRCEGPPHSYVRMLFGPLSVAATFQRNLRSILAGQEARHHAVLAEMETVLRRPPEPLEPPEAQGIGGS